MTNIEIQIGEYVRTNNARGIRKVARINEDATVNRYLFIDGYDHSDTIYGIIRADQITNHSFDLLDLIEAGDYVNGDKVIKKHNDYLMVGTEFINQGISNELIETVVTKEQFKSMEFKVGEDEY